MVGMGELFLGPQSLRWPWAVRGRPYVPILVKGRTPRTQIMSSPKQPDHRLAGSIEPSPGPCSTDPRWVYGDKGVRMKV